MSDEDPKLIDSPHSGHFTKDGVTVDVCIYRLEDTKWTLEVVDTERTSYVWNDEFETDEAAYREFIRTVETEGMLEFQVAASNRAH